jgi:hypothetical protein
MLNISGYDFLISRAMDDRLVIKLNTISSLYYCSNFNANFYLLLPKRRTGALIANSQGCCLFSTFKNYTTHKSCIIIDLLGIKRFLLQSIHKIIIIISIYYIAVGCDLRYVHRLTASSGFANLTFDSSYLSLCIFHSLSFFKVIIKPFELNGAVKEVFQGSLVQNINYCSKHFAYN